MHATVMTQAYFQLCNSEELWEHFVERHCDTVSEDMRHYAADVGWKHVSRVK